MFFTTLLLMGPALASPILDQVAGTDPQVAPPLFQATTTAPAAGVIPSTPAHRVRLVTLDLALLAQTAQQGSGQNGLTLNLFDDLSVRAEFASKEAAYGGGWIWNGTLANDAEGSVKISVMQQVVSATVFYQDELYQIDYAGNGVHWLRHSDPSGVPDCGTNDTHGIFSEATVAPRGGSGSRAAITDIDVLVVYSTAAKNVSGGTNGMQSKINLAVSETNSGYSSSGVDQQLILVHTEEMIGYSEPSSFSQILYDLADENDGDMDNVHALRDQYGADCVAMICQNGQYCGIAYLMTSVGPGFEDSAFSVTNYSCATGYYSFGHELGHNMGSTHDPGSAGSAAYSYSYGFRTSNSQYRTIMAYSPGTRVNRWSSPNVVYAGFTMGNSSQDNVRSLNNTASTVAAWRVNTPPTPTLQVGTLLAGFLGVANLSNMTASGSAVLAYSLNGNSPTSTPYGVADLSAPIGQFPSVTVNVGGGASVFLSVPAGASGTTVWFQALDLSTSTFTNGVETTVQ